MDTTPIADVTEGPTADVTEGPTAEVTEGPTAEVTDQRDHTAALEALAALDPADAPGPAETLAASLAHELEEVGAGPSPRQLEATFPAEEEGAS